MKPLEDSIFNNGNANAANVPHLPIWSNYSLGYVTTTTLLMHHLDGFSHGGSVLRMDCGQILLKIRSPVPGIKAVNFVDFVRPIEAQIVRPTDTQIPGCPAPHMPQAFPFAQIELASL